MFLGRTRARIAGLALAGTVFAIPAAASAGLVVKSSGPSSERYPVGAKLDDGATITLRTGDRITILTSKGTRVITGPGSHRVGDRAKVTRARFASLTRKRAATRARTGAVRGEEENGPITNPNIWYVDVTRSGTMCLYDLSTVQLWRSTINESATYRIADRASAAHVHVSFGETEMMAPLDPARMPIADGGRYTISSPDGAATAEVTFVSLDEGYDRADQLAQALIDKGCTSQLAMLADGLTESANETT